MPLRRYLIQNSREVSAVVGVPMDILIPRSVKFIAWIIGWALILEYGVAVAGVTNGWSGYFQNILLTFDIIPYLVIHSALFNFMV